MEQAQLPGQDHLVVLAGAQPLEALQRLQAVPGADAAQDRAAVVEHPEIRFHLEPLEDPRDPFRPVEGGDAGQDRLAQPPGGRGRREPAAQLHQRLLLQLLHRLGEPDREGGIAFAILAQQDPQGIQRGERNFARLAGHGSIVIALEPFFL